MSNSYLKWKKLVFSISFLIIFSFVGRAQQPKGGKLFYYPKKYDYPNGREVTDYKKDVKEGTFYVVFSDRKDNQTYTEANQKVNFTTLSFMQPLLVTDISGEFFRISSFDPDVNKELLVSERSNVLPPSSKDLGWIKRKNLLLWWKAIIDSNTNVCTKAVSVINSPEVIKNSARYFDEEGSMRIYETPGLTLGFENAYSMKIFNWLFVFKETENAYLVSTTPEIQPSSSTSVKGWVDKKLITKWTGTVCLRPNTNPQALKERKDKNMPANLFLAPEDARNYYLNGKINLRDSATRKEKYDEIYDEKFIPFPILSESNNIISTGYVTKIFDGKGKEVTDSRRWNDAKESWEYFRKEASKINIVFVIDGSEEMQPYVNPMVENINTTIRKFQKDYEENEINLGAVIYRDKSFESCQGDDYSVSFSSELTGSPSEMITWLKDNFDKKYQCTDSDPMHQNVYKGIRTALRFFNKREFQTNLIVVVGSKSNYEDESTGNLPDLLAQYNTGLFAIQAQRGKESSYQKFVLQFTSLINESNLKGYDKYKNVQRGKVMPPFDLVRDGENKYLYKNFYSDSSYYPGFILFTGYESQIKTKDFSKTLDDIIIGQLNFNGSNKADMDNAMGGWQKISDTKESSKDRKLSAQVAKALYYMGEKVEDILSNNNINDLCQFFIRGYTSRNSRDLSYPNFNPVLLYTEDDLLRLQNNLGQFDGDAISPDGMRDLVETAYKNVLKGFYGNQISEKEMGKKSLSEINKLISGIPMQDDKKIMKQYTLEKIRNMNNSDLSILFNKYKEASKRLESYFGGNPDMFTVEGKKLYWIPQDVLP